MKRAIVLLASAAVVAGCALFARPAEHATLIAREPAAKTIGSKACVECHDVIGDWYAKAPIHSAEPGCEKCHGAGNKHRADDENNGHIVKGAELAKMSPRGKSEMCLSCHEDKALEWLGGDHLKAGVACQSCHADAVHFQQPDAVAPADAFTGDEGAFCEQCHASVQSDFAQAFHHPVPEGEMGCRDCHDVHGSTKSSAAAVASLGGATGCAKCHASEAGPKVFRHDALDEGCAVCHDTHGSPLPAQLAQDGNALCLQCHLEPGFPTIAGVDHGPKLAGGARCWDCHVEVHGSDSDPTLLGRIR